MVQMDEKSRAELQSVVHEYYSKLNENISILDPNNTLQAATEHLQDGSLICAYAPHVGIDPIVASIFTRKWAKENPFSWIASAKYNPTFLQEPYKLKNMGFPVMGAAMLSDALHFKMFHVFQPDILSSLPADLQTKANAVNMESLRGALALLSQPGNILNVLPEGTRNTSGGLAFAREGSEFFLKPRKNHPPKAILPILMRGVHELYDADKQGFDGLNMDAKIEIVVGDMMSYADALKQSRQYQWVDGSPATLDDLIMLRIAEMAPSIIKNGVNPCGFYVPDNIQ